MTAAPFSPSPELYPFQSNWFESQHAGRVHYVDEGSGPPILMCHGNPTWSFLYRKVIVRLRDRFRCVAMDMPGFGLSDRPSHYGYTPAEHSSVLASLVEHLELDQMLVMAQDWGGPIGMSLAASSPTRVRGLVFMNTFYFPQLSHLAAQLNALTVVPAVSVLNRFSLPVEIALRLGTNTTLTRVEIDHYLGVQRRHEDRRGIAELPRHLGSEWLSELAAQAPAALSDKPMLLIWGMKDRLLGRDSVLERWRSDLPEAEILKLPHANHFLQEDGAQEIANAVLAKFGQGTPASAG